MNLEEKLSRTIDLLKTHSVDSYEICVAGSDSLRAEAKNGAVKSLDRASESGVSIRILKDGAIGFSYGREPNDMLLQAALISAGYQFKDEHNQLTKPIRAYAEMPIYDEEIIKLTPEACINEAIQLEQAARDVDCKIQQVRKATFSRGVSEIHIVNSNGVAAYGRSTGRSASIMVMAKDGEDMQAGYEYGWSHLSSGFDVAEIGRQASQKACAMLGATAMQTMRIPILLDNASTAEMLDIIGSSFLGENVLKGKSYLKDKLGAACFSPLVSLEDNPLDTRASDAFGFDGEGYPSQKNILINQGVVQSFVYDGYWGRVAGCASTGNAVRGGYRSMPGLGLRHMMLQPGSGLESELKGLGKVLKVTDFMGLHTADPITGEFSVGINGFLLDHGEVLHPIREAALAGNVYEMFARVLVVGDDIRAFGGISSPSILIDAMDVSSK